MTKKEADQIPELQIYPNDLVEDCFYYKMAKVGKISEESGKKVQDRLKGKEHDPCYKGAFIVANMMIANIEKYGIPCAEWCK